MHRTTVTQSMKLRKFSMSMYSQMVDDTARTESYARAMQEVVTDGDVVVDIGTGPFAVLARQAAYEGAGRVLALKANHAAAQAARLFLEKNASSDSRLSKVELIEGAR